MLVEKLYLPLVLAALSTWQGSRLYLALDTTILWDPILHDPSVSLLLWPCGPTALER